MGQTPILNAVAIPTAVSKLCAAVNPAFFLASDFTKRGDMYNILWVLVFGFATLNILGLVARKFEPERSRLSFGESLAIMVVLVSVVLLGWELLYLFKVLPFKIRR